MVSLKKASNVDCFGNLGDFQGLRQLRLKFENRLKQHRNLTNLKLVDQQPLVDYR